MARRRHRADRERVAVDVGVVRRRGDRDRCILRRRRGIEDRHRGSFTAAIVIVTVASLLGTPAESTARYVKLTMPLKLPAGVNVNDPSVLSLTLPSSGLTPLTSVAVSASPVSLASTPGAGMVRTASSFVS